MAAKSYWGGADEKAGRVYMDGAVYKAFVRFMSELVVNKQNRPAKNKKNIWPYQTL